MCLRCFRFLVEKAFGSNLESRDEVSTWCRDCWACYPHRPPHAVQAPPEALVR